MLCHAHGPIVEDLYLQVHGLHEADPHCSGRSKSRRVVSWCVFYLARLPGPSSGRHQQAHPSCDAYSVSWRRVHVLQSPEELGLYASELQSAYGLWWKAATPPWPGDGSAHPPGESPGAVCLGQAGSHLFRFPRPLHSILHTTLCFSAT